MKKCKRGNGTRFTAILRKSQFSCPGKRKQQQTPSGSGHRMLVWSASKCGSKYRTMLRCQAGRTHPSSPPTDESSRPPWSNHSLFHDQRVKLGEKLGPAVLAASTRLETKVSSAGLFGRSLLHLCTLLNVSCMDACVYLIEIVWIGVAPALQACQNT